VSGGRGGSAVADFAADKTLTLPDSDKRVPYGAGTTTTGTANGAATVVSAGTNAVTGGHALTSGENGAHTHGITTYNTATGVGTERVFQDTSASNDDVAVTDSSGSGTPHTHPGSAYTGSLTSVNQLGRAIYWYIKY
jgi:hypothetical protein